MSNHLGVSSLPMLTVEVCPWIADIAESYQIFMGAIGLVIVNVMNGQVLSGATFHALFAVALADRAFEFVVPLKGIGQLGDATVPIGMILSAYVLAVTLVFAGAAAKASNLELGRRDPEVLAANLASAILAPFSLFLAAWIAARRGCAAWGFYAKRLATNLTDAVLGIVLFGNATIPGAKAATIPVICSRRKFKGFATPAAVNSKAGAVSNMSTFLAAILTSTFPGRSGVVPEFLTARLAGRCHPGGAIRFLRSSVDTLSTAILTVVAFSKRKLELNVTLLAIHLDHRRHILSPVARLGTSTVYHRLG